MSPLNRSIWPCRYQGRPFLPLAGHIGPSRPARPAWACRRSRPLEAQAPRQVVSSDNSSMCKSLNFCGRPNRVPRSDNGARVGEGIPHGGGPVPLRYRRQTSTRRSIGEWSARSATAPKDVRVTVLLGAPCCGCWASRAGVAASRWPLPFPGLSCATPRQVTSKCVGLALGLRETCRAIPSRAGKGWTSHPSHATNQSTTVD